MRTARLLHGHVLDVLRGLPDESVHCVVTSPPYWGLRDYGLEPQAWGGEPGCDHCWGQESQKGGGSHTGRDLFGHSPDVQRQRQAVSKASTGAFCECGAWRGSLGLEPTIDLYVAHILEIFEEVRRVLRPDGTLWLNIGDSYTSGGRTWRAPDRKNPIRAMNVRPPTPAGLKPKDLAGVPWRVAFALQEAGWWLRSDCIWAKPNPMPESVTDRPTKAHEYVFLLTKGNRYFYDAEAVREPDAHTDHPRTVLHQPEPSGGVLPAHTGIRRAEGRNGLGRNLRTVWTIATSPFPEAHFATFPPELAEKCIKAATSEKGCCAACGAPWARITEVTHDNPGNRSTNGPRSTERKHLAHGSAGSVRLEKRVSTSGWRYTCSCLRERIESAGIVWPVTPGQAAALAPQFDDLAPVPCTVLDPFGGAGTVAMVALRLGREAISIDLNPSYIGMQERRIRDDAPLLNRVEISEGAA